MENSKKVNLIISVLFYFLISTIFYLETFGLNYLDLSSDQLNILPIIEKLKDTTLFKYDLYLDKVDNVKYYTPFFVKSIKYISDFFNLNVFSSFSLFFYIITLFFYLSWHYIYFEFYQNHISSLFFTIVSKIILWPPGSELWGLSSLWSFLPRSVFLAFLPLPFIYINKYLKNKNYLNILISGLLLGFISNFHPISGILFGFVLPIIFYAIYFLSKKDFFSKFVILLFFISFTAGFSFYILDYFNNISYTNSIDKKVFDLAIKTRISSVFFDPLKFISSTSNNIKLFIVFTHFVLIFMYLIKKIRIDLYLIMFFLFSFLTIIFSLSSVYIEKYFYRFTGINLYISFQYIRNFKYILFSSFVFFSYIIEYFFNNYFKNIKNKLYFLLLLTTISLSYISNYNNNIPTNDSIRYLIPFNKNSFINYDNELIDIINWINNNTFKDDKFIGPSVLRISTKRSIVFDFKGSSMLIEGNKEKFIDWYLKYIQLNNVDNRNKLDLYRSWGVNYVVTEEDLNNGFIIYSTTKWKIYKL
ncbi:hypothetical protein [Thermaurantimonas aggregans]|uniref:hypothetical protein n=1 Tax=Thermaurantimonas aggregans TaxID=2173829 RepID=UPI0023F2BBF6|nr:hypothetical protein [Thermaurantimonas aggregans]MCX8148591.1 hypothetical protein [Thermaurantimonas aggregans]